MITIRTDNGMDMNMHGIWSNIGIDLNNLLMEAEEDAESDLAVVNGELMPYATQVSVLPGNLASCFVVNDQSLFQVDVLVFANNESKLRYLVLNELGLFFIQRKNIQSK